MKVLAAANTGMAAASAASAVQDSGSAAAILEVKGVKDISSFVFNSKYL